MTRRASPGPRAARPYMPDYGILPADRGRGLLPWKWAVDRVERSRNYWVATVLPEGAPHAMAVWGIWHDGAFWFSTGARSRKARNLEIHPAISVATERADEAVIVQGLAELVRDPNVLGRVASAYLAKYGSGYPEDSSVYRVSPRKVFAFIESEEDFTGAATRWTFSSSPRRTRSFDGGAARKT